MILTQGVDDLTTDIVDDMSNGQAGTDSTLFSKTQTGLQSAVGATDIALSNKSTTQTTIAVTHILDVSTGNSNTFTEYEVNNGTISYNRSVKAGVAKTANNQLNVIHTFEVEVVS